MSIKQKIESMIIGSVIGDVLGVPVEFYERKDLKLEPVVDMREYGTHNQPLGTWSDDTSMTLAFIDALCHKDGWDVVNFAENCVEWYRNNKYTPHGSVFDIGIGTSRALDTYYSYRLHPSKCGISTINGNGNGALMRIHPIITLFLKEDLSINEKFNKIIETSYLTHNHNISHISCFFYIQFLLNILKYDKIEAYNKTNEDLKILFESNEELKTEELNFYKLMNNVYEESEENIYSTGYVIYSLEASIWSFMNTNNYKDAVLKAVNLGEDTDTIGAITGAISGLYYGMDNIPEEWINKLVKKDYIKSYANKISQLI